MEKKSLKTAPPVLSASLREIEDGLAYLQDARREDMLVEPCRIRGLMAENEAFYKLNRAGVGVELEEGQFFPYVAEGDGFEGQRCGGNNCVGREK